MFMKVYIYVFFHPPPMLFIKKAHIKTNDQTDTEKHHEKTFSPGNEDRLFLNGKCNLVIPLPEFRGWWGAQRSPTPPY